MRNFKIGHGKDTRYSLAEETNLAYFRSFSNAKRFCQFGVFLRFLRFSGFSIFFRFLKYLWFLRFPEIFKTSSISTFKKFPKSVTEKKLGYHFQRGPPWLIFEIFRVLKGKFSRFFEIFRIVDILKFLKYL